MVRTGEDGKPKPYGDDEPRKGRSAGVVVTIGVAVTIAAGGGAAGLVGAGSGAAGGAPEVSAGADVSVSVRSARTGRQKSDRTRARLSLRHADARATGDATTTDCAAQATGRVREFLLAHPCRSLQRGSFRVRPDGHNGAVVEVAWIEMPDADGAAELKELVDAPGSGHVRPLGRRGTLSGQHYASSRDGEIVTTAEAEPVTGRIETLLLNQLADGAAD